MPPHFLFVLFEATSNELSLTHNWENLVCRYKYAVEKEKIKHINHYNQGLKSKYRRKWWDEGWRQGEGVQGVSREHVEPNAEEREMFGWQRGAGLQIEKKKTKPACTKKQGIQGWRELGTGHWEMAEWTLDSDGVEEWSSSVSMPIKGWEYLLFGLF